MTYSVQTDNGGEEYATKSKEEALQKAIDISTKGITVFVTEVHGGDTGDINIAEYYNGKAVE